ncbi:MAG: HisA/HisF-related TIM barrel protein, partial [Candidatus Hodgkinia cicadicola]
MVPAIDIKDGKCVRLHKGLMSDCKQYAINASEVILSFQNTVPSCDFLQVQSHRDNFSVKFFYIVVLINKRHSYV